MTFDKKTFEQGMDILESAFPDFKLSETPYNFWYRSVDNENLKEEYFIEACDKIAKEYSYSKVTLPELHKAYSSVRTKYVQEKQKEHFKKQYSADDIEETLEKGMKSARLSGRTKSLIQNTQLYTSGKITKEKWVENQAKIKGNIING